VPHSFAISNLDCQGIPTVLLENTEMFPRRRPGSRSSACELGPISTEPAAPQTTTEAHQSEHALGFTDIYGSLTPRQVSIISVYPLPCTGDLLTQACSHWIGNRNGVDGWYWKGIVHVRSLIPSGFLPRGSMLTPTQERRKLCYFLQEPHRRRY
jgi:hypothetical protein